MSLCDVGWLLCVCVSRCETDTFRGNELLIETFHVNAINTIDERRIVTFEYRLTGIHSCMTNSVLFLFCNLHSSKRPQNIIPLKLSSFGFPICDSNGLGIIKPRERIARKMSDEEKKQTVFGHKRKNDYNIFCTRNQQSHKRSFVQKKWRIRWRGERKTGAECLFCR